VKQVATAATVAAVAMRWGKTVLNYESANKYAVIARRLKNYFSIPPLRESETLSSKPSNPSRK
jgi:hypothetical protein